jgi:GcrA cell cycle regulator
MAGLRLGAISRAVTGFAGLRLAMTRIIGGSRMQSSNWTREHCEALRDHLARGMSYSKIADALNAQFKTAYTRNATIGRARRMGLAAPERIRNPSKHCPKPPRSSAPPDKVRKRRQPEFIRIAPALKAEPARLRCVEVDPRHLLLVDLEPGDCRYPYGGDADGEPITFCGHVRREGSSYCTPHFHLTCGPGTAAERAVSTLLLRLVEAA